MYKIKKLKIFSLENIYQDENISQLSNSIKNRAQNKFYSSKSLIIFHKNFSNMAPLTPTVAPSTGGTI